MEKVTVARGLIKILIGLILVGAGGFYIFSGVKDVKVGILSDDPKVGVTLVSKAGCCKLCTGETCREVCEGDKVDSRWFIEPVTVCGNKGCRELKEGSPLKCEE